MPTLSLLLLLTSTWKNCRTASCSNVTCWLKDLHVRGEYFINVSTRIWNWTFAAVSIRFIGWVYQGNIRLHCGENLTFWQNSYFGYYQQCPDKPEQESSLFPSCPVLARSGHACHLGCLWYDLLLRLHADLWQHDGVKISCQGPSAFALPPFICSQHFHPPSLHHTWVKMPLSLS